MFVKNTLSSTWPNLGTRDVHRGITSQNLLKVLLFKHGPDFSFGSGKLCDDLNMCNSRLVFCQGFTSNYKLGCFYSTIFILSSVVHIIRMTYY